MLPPTKIALLIGIILLCSIALNFALASTLISGSVTTATTTKTVSSLSTVTEIELLTGRSSSSIQSSSSTSSGSSFSDFQDIAPSGLELQIVLNSSLATAGGGIQARIELSNVLNHNLTLTPDWSIPTNITEWGYADSLCGISPVHGAFGFALFKGMYTPANQSKAGSPLQLAPPIVASCPALFPQSYINRMVLAPTSSLATFYLNSSYPGGALNSFTANMDENATTGRCTTPSYMETVTNTINGTVSTYTTEQTALSCGPGSSLDGYWIPPINSSCVKYSGANSSEFSFPACDFRSFSPGVYTIMAQDLWNQTVYAYFQVLSTSQSPIAIASIITFPWPINYGGPNVGITLTNVADIPIIALSATLYVESRPYVFIFPVNSTTNPLMPGEDTSKVQPLVGADLIGNQSYPLIVSGMLNNGVEFSLTQQIKIIQVF